jgi:hypothetical protein
MSKEFNLIDNDLLIDSQNSRKRHLRNNIQEVLFLNL